MVRLLVLLVAAVVKLMVQILVMRGQVRVDEGVTGNLYLLQAVQYFMEPGGQEGHQAESQLLFQED
jgi:hypothetical protein